MSVHKYLNLFMPYNNKVRAKVAVPLAQVPKTHASTSKGEGNIIGFELRKVLRIEHLIIIQLTALLYTLI